MIIDGDEKPIGHVMSGGRLFDILMKLSLPVVAWPGQSIFRVAMHGHGFVLQVSDSPPVIGFVTTYFVTARTVREAEAKARKHLLDRWEIFYNDASGELAIEIEEVEELAIRFRARNRYGMAFYSSEE